MKIHKVHFDWSFRTFTPVMEEADRYQLDGNYGWAKSLRDHWIPHAISGVTAKPLPHFFTTFSRAVIGVTSQALAVSGVHEKLAECGELLPVTYEGHTYWLFNCLNLQDALDQQQSEIDLFRSGHRSASRPVIRRDFASDKWFFCVPESCAITFATESFHEFYEKHRLTGIEFTPQKIAGA